jgi:hypothetical protein
MTTLMLERADTRGARRRSPAETGMTTLRVAEGTRFLGEVLLDGSDRLWRHARNIPKDVVLKVLVAYTRQLLNFGKVTGRKDGRDYYWLVVDEEADEL